MCQEWAFIKIIQIKNIELNLKRVREMIRLKANGLKTFETLERKGTPWNSTW